MKTVKTYPPAVEAERQFLLAEIEKHWALVRAECRGLPPEVVKARIERAQEVELATLRKSLVGCELQAKLSIVLTNEEARELTVGATKLETWAAGALFPSADD